MTTLVGGIIGILKAWFLQLITLKEREMSTQLRYLINVAFLNFFETLTEFLKGGPNISKNLLSQFVEKFTSGVDNEMSQILIVWVSKNKLESFENNEKDPLSLEGLKHLLMKTLDTKAPKTELSKCDADEIKEVKTHLTPFIYYIDLNRMDMNEIMKYIEPVNIFSIEKLKDIYCSKRDKELPNIHEIPVFKWKNIYIGICGDENLSTTEQNYHGRARKPIVFGYGWDDIPSQVYPVVSLGCSSELRIEPVST
ncbi:6648_t:CDS:2, partial [Funneliformis caledonium]